MYHRRSRKMNCVSSFTYCTVKNINLTEAETQINLVIINQIYESCKIKNIDQILTELNLIISFQFHCLGMQLVDIRL